MLGLSVVTCRDGHGSGRPAGRVGSGRVELSEDALCEFCSFCGVSGRNCNEKCYISTLAKLQ